MTSNRENGGRTKMDPRPPLGGAGPLVDDPPGWHLTFADESIDARRWADARAALERGRESIAMSSAEADEAAFVAVRLALAEGNLDTATSEVLTLIGRMDPLDPIWNRRARRIISEALAGTPESVRTALLDRLPPIPGEVEAGTPEPHGSGIARVPVPARGLPELADDPWAMDVDEAARVGHDSGSQVAAHAPPPVLTESPFLVAGAVQEPDPASYGQADEVVVLDPGGDAGEVLPFTGRILVAEGGDDLTNADVLRERLVEEMLAKVTEEEAQLLFETATTFLNNGEPATAELMFSAAMQVPRLRLPACEGMIQALVAAERYVEAAAQGAKAGRLFASQGDALLGIVYWHGVAAQALGDAVTARSCFGRVGDSPDAVHFPDVGARLATVLR